jgi:integrase
MSEENSSASPDRKRAASKILESKTLKDGAIYLYRRSEYKKPIWFIRLKVPGLKGYIWKSSKTTDEYAAYKIAEDLYNEALGKLYAGVKLDAKRISVGIDAFVKHHEDRQTNTSIKYTISLAERLKPTLKQATFAELDTTLVAKMLDTISKQSRKGELSPNTIKRTHGHIKLMLRWWHENGYLEAVPAMPKASVQKNRRPHFDNRDWNKLTRYMQTFVKIDHGPVKRDRLLLVNYVLVMANTGLRVGEARMLKWRDIRPISTPDEPGITNVALLVKGKTGMRETVARTPEVKKYLERILDLRRADLTNPKSDIYGLKEVPLDS